MAFLSCLPTLGFWLFLACLANDKSVNQLAIKDKNYLDLNHVCHLLYLPVFWVSFGI